MPGQRLAWCAVLSGVAWASACTNDFTGYHLEASAAGASDGGSSGISGSGGGVAKAGGSGHAAGGPGSGGGAAGSDAEAGSGAEAGSPDVGSGGAATGGTGGAGMAGSGVVLLNVAPPSCQALAQTCGPAGSGDCCAASLVPGGTYDRSNLPSAPATVSDFGLDLYEVSVGRFRSFVASYSQTMLAAGAGSNPNNPNDPGWNVAWNAKLPATAAALVTAVQCTSGTYTAQSGANESKPMVCLSWYEAFAFCAWDGGRLATEAEWNYAAASGDEERTYPWGNTAPDDAHAVFCPGSCGVVRAVGSKAPLGNGRWGQADLVGNAWEWNLDVYMAPYPQASCQNCATTTASASSLRVFRGGSAGNQASVLLSATRNSRDPTDHNGFIGVRCARTP